MSSCALLQHALCPQPHWILIFDNYRFYSVYWSSNKLYWSRHKFFISNSCCNKSHYSIDRRSNKIHTHIYVYTASTRTQWLIFSILTTFYIRCAYQRLKYIVGDIFTQKTAQHVVFALFMLTKLNYILVPAILNNIFKKNWKSYVHSYCVPDVHSLCILLFYYSGSHMYILSSFVLFRFLSLALLFVNIFCVHPK